MKAAFMFAGQGAQYVEMGKDLYMEYEEVRNLFQQANTVVGYRLEEVLFENEEMLHNTRYTQTAMFVLYAAIVEVLKKHTIETDISFGLSLGEYGAYYHHGVFDFTTGVKLLEKRGELMSNVSEQVSGKMAAILGMDATELEAIIEDTKGYVTIANYNTYGQLVISGEEEAVLAVNEKALEKGAKRAILLNTSGPFHSAIMTPAKEAFSDFIEPLQFQEPKGKLLLNTTGDYYTTNLKEHMANQINHSVLFYQMVEKALADGVDFFIEIGPKKTLGSFVKKIDRTVTICNVEDLESLQNTIDKWEV